MRTVLVIFLSASLSIVCQSMDEEPPVKTAENDPLKDLKPEVLIQKINQAANNAKYNLKFISAKVEVAYDDFTASVNWTKEGTFVFKRAKGTRKGKFKIMDKDKVDEECGIEMKNMVVAYRSKGEYEKFSTTDTRRFYFAELFPSYVPAELANKFEIKLLTCAGKMFDKEYAGVIKKTSRKESDEEKKMSEELNKYQRESADEGQGDTGTTHVVELTPKDPVLKSAIHAIEVAFDMDTFIVSQVVVKYKADSSQTLRVTLKDQVLEEKQEVKDADLKVVTTGLKERKTKKK